MESRGREAGRLDLEGEGGGGVCGVDESVGEKKWRGGEG